MIMAYQKLLINKSYAKISNENFKSAIEYETENPWQNAINKFKNHPSIKMVISKINPNKRFFFYPILCDETLK